MIDMVEGLAEINQQEPNRVTFDLLMFVISILY